MNLINKMSLNYNKSLFVQKHLIYEQYSLKVFQKNFGTDSSFVFSGMLRAWTFAGLCLLLLAYPDQLFSKEENIAIKSVTIEKIK
ncbi:MAG: hypothetical protein OEZ34_12470, partial [Spirochaetia bacterium]|nr:hypothetical protein [Spirochaetia bacterium]